MNHPALLTVEQAATRLAVSQRTVRRLVASGQLPAVRLGRLVRVSPVMLEAYLATSAMLHTQNDDLVVHRETSAAGRTSWRVQQIRQIQAAKGTK